MLVTENITDTTTTGSDLWEVAEDAALLLAEAAAHPHTISDDEWSQRALLFAEAKDAYLTSGEHGIDPVLAEEELVRLSTEHPEDCSSCAERRIERL